MKKESTNKSKQQKKNKHQKNTGTTYVYVLNRKGDPLMPTNRCGHVRILLKYQQAHVVRKNPFTIQLNYNTPDITQPLYLGIDPGRENIGLAVSNEQGECVYQSELKTENKQVHKNMQERKIYRQLRRGYQRDHKQRRALKNGTELKTKDKVKIKYKDGKGDEEATFKGKKCNTRSVTYPKMGKGSFITSKVIRGSEAQFANRRRKDDWITPSGKQLLHCHKEAIKKVNKLLPITDITLELNKFDFQKIEYKLQSREGSTPETDQSNQKKSMYKGVLRGYESYKTYISELQQGKCLLCETNNIDHYHHIVQKSKGGSDTVSNIAGLCKNCHDLVHKEREMNNKLRQIKQGMTQKFKISLLNSIMPRLIKEIEDYCTKKNIKFSITDGYTTKLTREQHLKIDKTHSNDAYVISLAGRSIDFKSLTTQTKKDTILPDRVHTLKRFSKKHKNIINQQKGDRIYYLGKEPVAVNRHKRIGQEDDSLEEYKDKYLASQRYKYTNTVFEKIKDKLWDQQCSKLRVEQDKRIYTYRKPGHSHGLVRPVNPGDIVRYTKTTKGKTETKTFIVTKVAKTDTKKGYTWTLHYEENGKDRSVDVNYCKRISSGSIQYTGFKYR